MTCVCPSLPVRYSIHPSGHDCSASPNSRIWPTARRMSIRNLTVHYGDLRSRSRYKITCSVASPEFSGSLTWRHTSKGRSPIAVYFREYGNDCSKSVQRSGKSKSNPLRQDYPHSSLYMKYFDRPGACRNTPARLLGTFPAPRTHGVTSLMWRRSLCEWALYRPRLLRKSIKLIFEDRRRSYS